MTNNREIEKLRKELEELQAKYDFLMSAVEHLPNPIFMKDGDGRFFFFNKAYADFFKMRRRDYIGSTVMDLEYLPLEKRERFRRDAMKLINDQDITTYDANFQTEDGVDRPSLYWACGFRDEATNRTGLVGEIVDISKERQLQESLDRSLEELKDSNEKLRIMAETDYISGLFNRSIMWSKGREYLRLSKETGKTMCIIMFDLDRFKKVNDGFGHLKGDETLADFANILRTECRTIDLPIRYGGDEFLLLLHDITQKDAAKVAERIRLRCEKELSLPDGSNVTVSIGVLEADTSRTFEDNLSKLDTLLYRAKREGRNCIAVG